MMAGALLLVGGASAVGVGFATQAEAPRVPPAPAVTASDLLPLGDVGGGRPDRRLPALGRSEPVALAIPSIGVDTAMMSVGLNPDGTLEVPPPGPTYDLAAWYRHSPTPGELGPSVVEGHLDSADGPSVFFRLGELTPGDTVEVRRADGVTAVFRVTSTQRYAKAAFPTSAVYGDLAHAGLRLVTCGGAIDPATGHYADNVVVYAVLAAVR